MNHNNFILTSNYYTERNNLVMKIAYEILSPIAEKYSEIGHSYDDLYNEGILIIINKCDKFLSQQPITFLTYYSFVNYLEPIIESELKQFMGNTGEHYEQTS